MLDAPFTEEEKKRRNLQFVVPIYSEGAKWLDLFI
jgi:hypothetical protein